MYPKAGRMRECPIPRSSDGGTSGKFPPRSLKSQTKKYTFDNDDHDQNTNTNTKSENSKKNKFKKGNGNGKKQVVDEVPEQDSSDPSINDIVTDSDTSTGIDTDTDTNVIVTDTDTDNNDTWKTYCMKCFTSRFHKVTIVLFALANILQYSFLQAINFEYVNAICFIHSVVCNWFLEDSIADMKAEMKAEMKVMENKLEAVGNKLEAEKSSSAASKAEDQIRFTAIEAELKQKVNKIGYQDTKIEKRDTTISNLEKENTDLRHDLYESNQEGIRLRSKVKECCDCATVMAEKYDGANMTVIEREKTTTRGEAKTAMTEIIVEQSLVRYGLDVPRNKKEYLPLHLAADHIKRAKKRITEMVLVLRICVLSRRHLEVKMTIEINMHTLLL